MRIRKSFLIVLMAIIIFAVMYVSLAYFIGLQAEKKIIALIKAYNSEQTQISVKEYKRNIFNSTVHLEVQYEDYNQFNLDLEILHSPILQYIDNQGNYKFYFGKLLVKMRVFQIFLQEKKEIFSNVSVVDLKSSSITIDVPVGDLTRELYQKLGIYSFDKYENTAHIQLNEGNVIFSLTSSVDNQFTGDGLYKIKNSNLNISAQFFTDLIKPNEEPYDAQSKINIILAADQIINDEKNQLTILNLDKPNVLVNYSGNISSFMEVINTLLMPVTASKIQTEVHTGNNTEEENDEPLLSENLYLYQNTIAKLLQIIFTDDNPSLLKVHYKNNKGEFYNKDEIIKINNLDQEVVLGSTDKNFFLRNKSAIKDVIFKNKITDIDFNNLSFIMDFSTDKELDKNFSTFEQFDFIQFIQSLLVQTNLDNFAKYRIETNFNLDKLKYKALAEGSLSADQINFNFSIKNSQVKNNLSISNENSTAINNIAVNNANDIKLASLLNFTASIKDLILNYSDDEVLDVNIKNINVTNSMNLTEYLNFFDHESQDGYNINFNSKANIPYIKYKYDDFNIDISQIMFNSKFKLDSKIRGYFDSDFEINKITASTDIGKFQLDKIILKSNLKQAYKNIMTGKNDMAFTKFAWVSRDKKSKILGDSFRIINSTDLDDKNKDYLSYSNKINLNRLNYDQLDLGVLNYEDKYTNISADKYIKFTTRSAADYIDESTNVDSSNTTEKTDKTDTINNNQDDIFQQADLNQFLSIGMDISSNLFLGKKDSNITMTNVINIPAQDLITNQSNTEFLNNLQLNSTVAISRDYIEQFLKVTEDSELLRQYDIWQKIGLLNFNQSGNSAKNKANIVITYSNNKLNINSQPMDYWLEKMRNFKNRPAEIKANIQAKDIPSKPKAKIKVK